MKNYNLKDVLLSLKKEYVEYNEILESLKRNVYIEGKKQLDSFNFYLDQTNNQSTPELKCKILKKENKFDIFGIFRLNISNQTRTITKNYKMIIKEGKICIFGNNDNFSNKLELLLNSDFAQKIYINELKINHNYLKIDHNLIQYNWFNKNDNQFIKLIYNPITDEIDLSYNNNFSKNLIENILYSKIDINLLPTFHQQLIDFANEPVEIMDLPKKKNNYLKSNTEFETMEFVEQNKIMVLRNKNRK